MYQSNHGPKNSTRLTFGEFKAFLKDRSGVECKGVCAEAQI